MKTTIDGAPAFAHLHVDLDPGESIVTESDAMVSMAPEISVKARLNGGIVDGLKKKFLGNESLFLAVYGNGREKPLRVTIAPPLPGEIGEIDLAGGRTLFLRPGAYLCSTPDVKVAVRYAGVKSWMARSGLFCLTAWGTGKVWYSAFGGLLDKEIDGEYIVDTGHLVGYESQIKLSIQLPGTVFSSILGGEGIVTRLEGKGRIAVQTRSLSGFASWLNPRL